MFRNIITAFLLVLFSMLAPATTVSAMSEENTKELMKMSEQERKFLLMYFDEEELFVISATRSLKSVTRVAENVEVISKEDIELMNAHTLADVLNTVNGVQVNFKGGIGGEATAFIQGANFDHVAVFMDGVFLNNLNTNAADIGFIPVQNIEKIEIIKGPASSAWGSSLGGVVNIITKAAEGKDKLSGTVSASYGERNTGDFRAEAYGKQTNFGYYLSAGRLQSDGLGGLRPNNDFWGDNLYTKLSYEFSKDTNLLFTLFYNRGSRGKGEYREFDYSDTDRLEQLFSTLSLNTALSKEVKLNISLRTSSLDNKTFEDIFSSATTDEDSVKSRSYGASANLNWQKGIHNIVVGTDFDSSELSSVLDINRSLFDLNNNDLRGRYETNKTLSKVALYANDTISIDNFSIIPGIRFDHTNIFGDFISPSLGLTYVIAKNTVLRVYAARGFNLPSLGSTYIDNPIYYYKANPDLKTEKIMSYNAGIETSALKHIWFKVSLFRHDIKDAITESFDGFETDPVYFFTFVNKSRLRNQGLEIELKTAKFYNTVFFAGASLVYTKNLDTGEEIKNVPTSSYDIGLKYDDGKSFRALLKGRYVCFNAESFYESSDNSFIFDLNLVKTLYRREDQTVEIFASGHNIFNGSQYSSFLNKNPERWFEAGLRYKF